MECLNSHPGYIEEETNLIKLLERDFHNRFRFCSMYNLMEYPEGLREEIAKDLMEAWSWLEREGLLAPPPGSSRSPGDVFITRRGRRITQASDLDAYRKGSLLPKQQLHPVIAQKVWSAFLRGEYDTSVFQAFKEVEVAVRNATGFPPTEVGVPLMRRAFDKTTGPLSAKDDPEAERDALAHLFAGAIGSYKNPQSHRHVPIEPDEAVEMIILASHLLRIVDSRAGGNKEGA